MKQQSVLYERFSHLEHLLHRYYGKGKHKDICGHPSRGQARILSILKRQPEISQRDLCFMLDMRKQSLGEILAKLEHKGYITRTPSQEDQRAMIVRLTQEGETAVAEMESQVEKKGNVFGVLDTDEQARLLEYLNRITAAVEEELEALPEEVKEALDREHYRHHHHSRSSDLDHLPEEENPPV